MDGITDRPRHGRLLAAIVATALAVTAAGCGGSDGDSSTASAGSESAAAGGTAKAGGKSGKLKVVYARNTQEDVVQQKWLEGVKRQFESSHPGVTVELNGIVAPENEYYTKIDLMQSSASTAPDVVYADTFLVNSDVKAGYLAPLDDYLSKWADWNQFEETAKNAAKSTDGHIYGVPVGTDTRALWYNKELFQKAGLPTDWQPKTWNDVLSAARTIKSKVPGVIPLNVYSGKPAGEASAMQGFEMLLYGTGDELYNSETNKWIAPSKGLTSSFQFIKTIFDEKLTTPLQTALNPNVPSIIQTDMIPAGKVAINLDGFWISSNWGKAGAKPWPEWSKVMGVAAMPTQNGEEPGSVSLSGGWLYSISKRSKNPDLAFEFIKEALNAKNTAQYDVMLGNIAVRKDVAKDPTYTQGNPTTPFFTDLVKVTHYRPAFAEYPRISNAIQEQMEAVMTGQASPEQATERYTQQVKAIATPDKVESP